MEIIKLYLQNQPFLSDFICKKQGQEKIIKLYLQLSDYICKIIKLYFQSTSLV